MIHASSDVQSSRIGEGTRIWQFCVVLPGAIIGRDCNICSHCFVENDVVIGDRVTVKSGVQLWDGLCVEDDVFIGPNATFTNDRHPRSGNRGFECLQTTLESGCSVGAGAVILAVGHDHYRAMGATGVRALAKAGGVVYDVKGVLPRDAVDGRL